MKLPAKKLVRHVKQATVGMKHGLYSRRKKDDRLQLAREARYRRFINGTS